MARNDAPVSIMMPVELKEEFTAIAKKHQRSITQELIIAAREYIAREKGTSPGTSPGTSWIPDSEQIKELFDAWFEDKIKELKND